MQGQPCVNPSKIGKRLNTIKDIKMNMKKEVLLLMLAAGIVCGSLSGCKGAGQRPVNGTMDSPVAMDGAPEAVMDALKPASAPDDRFEVVMEDKASGVTVWSLLNCSEEVSSEGYGMVVAKGDVMTALPQVRHGRMPRARYDAATGDLWVVGSAVEGTGVQVEMPYLLRFLPDGHAAIASVIDPYEIQQAVCKAMTYSIDGQDITFYGDGKELVTVTNHTEDMGEFMDDAIYVGEQIAYGLEGPLTVQVTPGLNFVTGKVLLYDDMPTFTGTVTLAEDGKTVSLGELKVMKE